MTDGPIDRFAWLEVTDLPIVYWNVNSNNKILSAYGRISFDKISFWYSSLVRINILAGTIQSRFIKESVNFKLRGTDYHVIIQEHDPLHFPVFDAIEYNMKAFNLMLEEEDVATDQSSRDGMALQRLQGWKEGWLYPIPFWLCTLLVGVKQFLKLF